MSCSGQKDGLALNHPPFVISIVGDYIPIPEERNGIYTIRKRDARFLHQGKDASPDILCLLRKYVAEHIPQRFPLKGRRPIRAKPVVNFYKVFREGGSAEAVAQGEQQLGVGGDSEGNVVLDGDRGHNNPFPLLSQGRLYKILFCS